MGWWRKKLTGLAESHDVYLASAAGISAVVFACQPDMWDAIGDLAEIAGVPLAAADRAMTSRDDGLSEISLSGIDLVQLLGVTRAIHGTMDPQFATHYKYEPAQRAIAWRAYVGIAQALDQVQFGHPDGERMPPIVIDDRIVGESG